MSNDSHATFVTHFLVAVLFSENYWQVSDQSPETRGLAETGNALLLQCHPCCRQHLGLVIEIRWTVGHQHVLRKHHTNS